jgi:hypothetical protein
MAGSYRGSLTAGGKADLPNVIDISDIGRVDRTDQFRCDITTVGTHTPAIGSTHPTDTRLKLRSARREENAAQIATVSLFYVGWLETLPDARWAIDVSTGEEPIILNVNFEQLKIEALAEDGYIVDDDGIFKAFTAPAEIAGIESFLAPRLTLRKRYVTTTFPATQLNLVAKVEAPDFSEIASITPTGYNWLKIGCPVEDLLGAWEVTEVWLRSGPLGWNTTIYGDPVT